MLSNAKAGSGREEREGGREGGGEGGERPREGLRFVWFRAPTSCVGFLLAGAGRAPASSTHTTVPKHTERRALRRNPPRAACCIQSPTSKYYRVKLRAAQRHTRFARLKHMAESSDA